MSKRFLSGINVTGTATLNTVANAGLDTDKFLVLDAAGNIDFRTGDELKIDIGANVVSRIEHEVKLGETMSIGTPVYVGVDLNAGTNMTVYKASNATEARSSKTMGLVASSGITNDLVEVITEGLLEGLNTSTATKGDPVWLGVDGALIFGLANKPVAPAHLVSLGVVTRVQQNNGEIFVKVQNGFEMNEIHNYLEGSVQNNQVIVYESATSLYKPKTIPTILGYTPVPNSRTLTINGTTYDLTADRSWTISANQNARTEYEFTTNGSTATYSATYTVGQVDVFYNGSKLSSAEFTATNGTSVTLAFTPPTGQLVEVVAWETGGGVSNGRTLTINGTSYDLSADRSWTVTDSSKLPLSGGTLTGALNGTSALFTDNLRTDTGLGLKYGSFVSTTGYLNLFSALVGSTYTLNLKNGSSGFESALSFNNNANRTYTFPNTNGTIALLESTNIFSGFNWFVGTAGMRIDYGIGMTKGTAPDSVSPSWVNVYSDSGDKNLVLIDSFTSFAKLQFQNTGNLTYTFPASSGTVALTSNLSAYLPLSGGTLTGALNGTSATFSSNVGIRTSTSPYSPLTVTGAGIAWGETVTYYPASNGYITLAFRLEGIDTINGTWAFGKQSTQENGGVQYLQIAKNGLTGSSLHRPDAVQIFDPSNGNSYFGFNVGIGTTSPFNFGSIHRTLDVRGSGTSSIGALFVGNSDRSAVLGFYINPAAAGTVGTSSNHALQLVTNDIERIRITTIGNVGIGTGSPTDYSGYNTLHINGKSGANSGVVRITAADGSAGFNMYSVGAAQFNTTSAVPFIFLTRDTERLRITDGGSVGIGTTIPGNYILALDYNASSAAVMSIKNSSVSGYSGAHIMNNSGTVMGHWGYANGGTGAPLTDTVYFGSTAAKSVVFTTADTIRMTINTSGHVTRPFQPAFFAYSSGFTVTGGIWQLISNNINTESYDIGSNYSSGRFTAPVSGRYLFYFGGWANISSNNGDRYAVSFSVNGGGYLHLCGGNYSTTDSPLSGATIVHNLNAGDYVELYAFSIIGGTWGGGHSVFWGGYLL